MRVLVVEDTVQIRKSVVRALRASGYRVDESGDGEEGLWLAEENDYDVAILDIMLPGIDGREALKRLRGSGKDTPVLFLTALDAIEDRVEGLRMGADDYLVKPFVIDELLARVEALSRRRYQQCVSTVSVGDLEMDRSARIVTRGGKELTMSPQSFALLEYLMLRSGQVVTRGEIEEKIYDELASPMSNVVEKAVYLLRKAISVDENDVTTIQTRRGMGYVLKESDR
ncbi:response regulator transcription factor [Pelagicoccus mobilis]|uniref:Response regulator transcription factor n=1 Tax=Pelagicoccus mobilis TaxID=415221 RepID=A0A934RWA1_9BACT|nr:response regulator transcription factor [Pelagicoccus mobilis]MBK1875956.1 response regulator transcription factor [Pelagicoccus mobilis]